MDWSPSVNSDFVRIELVTQEGRDHDATPQLFDDSEGSGESLPINLAVQNRRTSPKALTPLAEEHPQVAINKDLVRNFGRRRGAGAKGNRQERGRSPGTSGVVRQSSPKTRKNMAFKDRNASESVRRV